jgi:endonuclease YncB( thermonuclease family)
VSFTVIPGAFRVSGVDKNGRTYGFEPDGDSIRFLPDDRKLIEALPQLGSKVEFNAIGAVQLRLEGVDALELHFAAGGPVGEIHQPRPAADDARDFLTKFLGLNPIQYVPPKNLTVQPPVTHDGTRGYILSRTLEVHGRPVAFLFTGQPPATAGSQVFLDPKQLRQSLNYALLRAGQAYPLYYDTLFNDLRNTFSQAVQHARSASGGGKGLWKADVTNRANGLTVNGVNDLETRGFVFPKLFRRLGEWLATGATSGAGFATFPKLASEQVIILDPTAAEFTNVTHLDNVVDVKSKRVRLRFAPEHLVFVSEK